MGAPGTAVTEVSGGLLALPELPEHHHPIKHMPEAERARLLSAVLSHYELGTEIADIAAHLGVSERTIYRSIKRFRSEEWREITVARYESEVDQAQRELKTSTDPNVITRARERLRIATWMLERLDRAHYSQDVTPDQLGRVSITLNIGDRKPLDVVAEQPKTLSSHE